MLEVPFTTAGEIDTSCFARLVRHVLASGVTAVMFPGFASEVLKLTDAEREELTHTLLQHTKNRDVAAIVSIPDHSTEVAVRRATDAAAAGADVVNILPPHQLSPGPSAVQGHLEAVLAAVAPTPVMVQFAPAQTGSALTADDLARLRQRSPNLKFVKVESTPPGAMITALRSRAPDVGTLVGYAGLHLMDAWRRGAVGVQPGCSFIELYLRVWALLEAGEEAAAERLHSRMLPYLSYWMQGVEIIVAAEKLISARRGLVDDPYCRRPRHTLDTTEVAMVDRFLDEFADLLPDVRA
ncbi:dihydrodipicolinate synthase family protein [Terrabacter terrigena]|uniref:Dihydrodipicolinate synthase family protein n=1 Tax=Terrabacter terrigena TaxID=574718 RepID=A0ABW3MSF4_9MICO